MVAMTSKKLQRCLQFLISILARWEELRRDGRKEWITAAAAAQALKPEPFGKRPPPALWSFRE